MSLQAQIRSVRVRPSKLRRLPGVEGIWVFVAADMTVFGILFTSFMLGRRHDVGLFEASRHGLNPDFGGVNTLILLTSSWFIALAVDAARRNRTRTVSAFLAATFLCGVAFTGSKVIEYAGKLGQGVTMLTNDFYMYYFTLTGIHLGHVIAGSVVLAVLWMKSRTGTYNSNNMRALESGATYWHMVDLLWVMLFPLLYLLR